MAGFKFNRKFAMGAALASSVLALGIGQALLQKRADAQAATVQAPIFEVEIGRAHV